MRDHREERERADGLPDPIGQAEGRPYNGDRREKDPVLKPCHYPSHLDVTRRTDGLSAGRKRSAMA